MSKSIIYFKFWLGDMKPRKQWCYRPDEDRGLASELAAGIGVSELVGALLLQRGIDSVSAARDFLWPSLAQLPSPLAMKGMGEAVDILVRAILEQRQIIIYGDYDVDGITGIAVLVSFFRELGVECQYCMPERLKQGYGFSSEVVENAPKDSVVVTVDCGISDVAEVARAKEMGLAVIVTDHHQPPAELPGADAILNPLQPGCEFPFKYLAGVGVAFYLIMGLRGRLVAENYFKDESQIPNLRSFLDFVAVGTICDMVPLVGVNRIMVIAGLQDLAAANRPGFRHLFDVSGVDGRHLAADDIGYRIGPRLNAPGRLGNAGLALQLLICDDDDQAKSLASQLDQMNLERREVVRQIAEEASGRAAELVQNGANVLILHDDNWHAGVLGIVASKLANDFNRPTILLRSGKEGFLKGSGRSVLGFDLHDALAKCTELLENYGGHSAAVGVSLERCLLEELVGKLDKIVFERLAEAPVEPLLWIDQVVDVEELNRRDFIEGYLRLAPFGIGNPEPVFAPAKQISFEDVRLVGSDHLKFVAKVDGVSWGGIGFGLGGFLDQFKEGLAVPAFTVRKNFFRGREEWQLSVVDLAVK